MKKIICLLVFSLFAAQSISAANNRPNYEQTVDFIFERTNFDYDFKFRSKLCPGKRGHIKASQELVFENTKIQINNHRIDVSPSCNTKYVSISGSNHVCKKTIIFDLRDIVKIEMSKYSKIELFTDPEGETKFMPTINIYLSKKPRVEKNGTFCLGNYTSYKNRNNKIIIYTSEPHRVIKALKFLIEMKGGDVPTVQEKDNIAEDYFN